MTSPTEIRRIIRSEACIEEGAKWLAEREPRFAAALKITGPLPLRLRRDGFRALLDTIVSQQISVAAATAIWQRLEQAGLTGPQPLLRASEDELRACGLSRPKIRYAQALAQSRLDYKALRNAPTETVIRELIKVPGIGRWSAQIYAMFSLGHADVFAAGDLALQEAARLLFDLPERPTERIIRNMAGEWSPWRAVAARLLWAYYRQVKMREGIR